MLSISAHPLIRVASEIIFLTDTSTYNPFFKSAFDVVHLPSPLALNNAAYTGASSYGNRSFILFLSAECKSMTLEKITFVFHISVTFSFFVFDRKPSGKLLSKEVNYFPPISTAVLTLTVLSAI